MRVKDYHFRYFCSVLMMTCLLMMGCQNQVQGQYTLPNYYANGAAFGAPAGGLLPTFMHLGLTSGNAAAILAAGGVAIGSRQDARNLAKSGVKIFQVGDEVTIVMPSDKFFRSDSPTFRYESYPAMESLAKLLRDIRGTSDIMICGFDDNTAGDHYSHFISRVQAQSVMAYLWTHAGIPWIKMRVIAVGQDYPVATNLTVTGKAMNRHIEIRVRKNFVGNMGRV